jgi:hypothetical protein
MTIKRPSLVGAAAIALAVAPLGVLLTALPAQAATSAVSGNADCWGIEGLYTPAPAKTIRIQISGESSPQANVNLLGRYSVTMRNVPSGGTNGTATINCLNGYSWNMPVRISPGSQSLDLTNPTPIDISVNVLDPSNQQPVNPIPIKSRQQRPLTVSIYNASNQLVTTRTTTASFRGGTADEYDGTVYAGHIPTGSYAIKVNLDYTLIAQTGYISLTETAGHRMPPNRQSKSAALTPGDLNTDNVLNITDYNLLMNCYSDLLPPRGPCSNQQKIAADITMDGLVNGLDYNLMLRIFGTRGGD